ncbi:HNH endonuclease [Micromonospora sp. C81]|uniref:HNH endonuclease n=1 Tax=Micromonospora sp. C81 TaxID=2824881 RepID=UPI001B37B3C4|nr:HNH endonuclease signature motif containing protein [Micromonospora sp. C81]MBQ1035876.1 HNH endonuclease [Micromonospora sp. C81]
MYSLTPPNRDDWEDFLVMCTRRAPENRSVLSGVSAQVEAAYVDYHRQYQKPSRLSAISITKEQSDALKGNFDLFDVGRPFRTLRTQLMAEARNRKCPMCGHRDVATLDHFLPKSVYPEYSALSINLVPVCPYCNNEKGNKLGDAAGRRFIHAYYDTLPETELLVADVTVDSSVFVTFRIDRPSGFADPLIDNLEYHFKELKLGECFESEAFDELTGRAGTFHYQYANNGGEQGLAAMLSVEAVSERRKAGLNSWRVALYNALARNRDFCSSGFRLLSREDWDF